MKIPAGGLGALLLTALLNGQTVNRTASCEALASLTLPNTTITLAQVVSAGAFSRSATGTSGAEQAFSNSVPFCRVAATLKPSSDSDIKIEVWLPVSAWNGKFQAVGNGGWAGTISYLAMAEALRRGYAATSTDTGHAGAGGSFALGHPEKFIDFAYRAVHEMTVTAKVIVNAFYGSAPTYAYWNGCSTGGRQGLAEVQRHPNDFDGVIPRPPSRAASIRLFTRPSSMPATSSTASRTAWSATRRAATSIRRFLRARAAMVLSA